MSIALPMTSSDAIQSQQLSVSVPYSLLLLAASCSTAHQDTILGNVSCCLETINAALPRPFPLIHIHSLCTPNTLQTSTCLPQSSLPLLQSLHLLTPDSPPTQPSNHREERSLPPPLLLSDPPRWRPK